MLQKLENALLDLFRFTALLLSLIKSGVENGNKLSKTNKDQSKKIRFINSRENVTKKTSLQ